MALRIEWGIEAQDVRAEFVIFDGEDSRGYPHISSLLKPNTRRHYRYPEKSILREDAVEDGKTPRGFWHYMRNSAMLRVIEKTELED